MGRAPPRAARTSGDCCSSPPRSSVRLGAAVGEPRQTVTVGKCWRSRDSEEFFRAFSPWESHGGLVVDFMGFRAVQLIYESDTWHGSFYVMGLSKPHVSLNHRRFISLKRLKKSPGHLDKPPWKANWTRHRCQQQLLADLPRHVCSSC